MTASPKDTHMGNPQEDEETQTRDEPEDDALLILDLMKVRHAAYYSGVHAKTITKWCRQGKIRSWGRGRVIRVRLEDILPLRKPAAIAKAAAAPKKTDHHIMEAWLFAASIAEVFRTAGWTTREFILDGRLTLGLSFLARLVLEDYNGSGGSLVRISGARHFLGGVI
jgi:hypothetical protein